MPLPVRVVTLSLGIGAVAQRVARIPGRQRGVVPYVDDIDVGLARRTLHATLLCLLANAPSPHVTHQQPGVLKYPPGVPCSQVSS